MAIGFHGQTWVPATDNATTPLGSATPHSITPPASMTDGMTVIVACAIRNNTDPAVSNNGGQGWTARTLNTNGTTCAIKMWSCTFNGTWDANPSFTTESSTDGVCFWMGVFTGVASNEFDVSPTAIDFASASSKTLPSFNTGVANAWAMFIWAEPDDNALSGQDADWTGPDGSTGSLHDHVGNQGGSDIGLFLSKKLVVSAGASGSNVVALNTADVGAGYYFSLRPGGNALTGDGAVETVSAASGSALLALLASGAATAVSATTGNATIQLVASGSVESVSAASGDATVSHGEFGDGAVVGISSVSGNAMVAILGIGTVAASSSASANSTVELIANGSVAAVSTASGDAIKDALGNGAVISESLASGSATINLQGSDAIISGSLINGNAIVGIFGSGIITAASTITGDAIVGGGGNHLNGEGIIISISSAAANATINILGSGTIQATSEIHGDAIVILIIPSVPETEIVETIGISSSNWQTVAIPSGSSELPKIGTRTSTSVIQTVGIASSTSLIPIVGVSGR